jgi:hypothetical protein
MIGKPISKARAFAVKSGIKATGDGDRALQLWKDLKWQLNLAKDDPAKMAELVQSSIDKAGVELTSPTVRDAVVKQLTEMLSRLKPTKPK